MNVKLFNNRLGSLLQQRNFLVSMVAILIGLNLIQSLALLFREDKVVVVPADLRQEIWVKGNKVSMTYLEEMGILFADLILETTPKGAAFRRDVILRNSSASGYGSLRLKLLEEEKRLKKMNLSTSFQANSVKVDQNKLAVEIKGHLLRYVGEKRISQSLDVYRFEFEFHRGRLLIKSFKLIKSDKNET